MSSPRLRALVVDDERPARDKLKRLLSAHPEIDLVGEAGNGPDAVHLIEAKRPDLIFLDIEMPGMSGFDVLDALDVDALPRIVFVTAFDEFAVRAFEVRALDYLLKPVDRDRFEETLHRVFDSVGKSARESDEASRLVRARLDELGAAQALTRFMVREQGRIFFVLVRDVRYIEAAGNYVELHLDGKSHLVRGSLGELEKRLDASRFARVHRSTIVNLDAIEALHPFSHGDFIIVLKDGRELRMSRRYRDRLPGRLRS